MLQKEGLNLYLMESWFGVGIKIIFIGHIQMIRGSYKQAGIQLIIA
jgi:hypothetical protein